MSIIRKLSHLILYSSLWIGACAAALVTFTYDVTGSGIGPDAYVGFVFCGTLALYSAHRLIGIERVRKFADQGRFAVIREFRFHIVAYGASGVLGALYFLLRLPFDLIWWLVIPGLFSFMYVVPFGKRKRWRDYAFVKIFFVAVTWAALTGLIPYVHSGNATWVSGSLLFFERALFIFAIAIPFDIRDMHVDDTSGVKTFPQVLGIRRSKLLAIGILLFSAIITSLLILTDVYDHRLALPFVLCWFIISVLIWNSEVGLDDYYYSGLLDGMLFLLPFGYWVATL